MVLPLADHILIRRVFVGTPGTVPLSRTAVVTLDFLGRRGTSRDEAPYTDHKRELVQGNPQKPSADPFDAGPAAPHTLVYYRSSEQHAHNHTLHRDTHYHHHRNIIHPRHHFLRHNMNHDLLQP